MAAELQLEQRHSHHPLGRAKVSEPARDTDNTTRLIGCDQTMASVFCAGQTMASVFSVAASVLLASCGFADSAVP